MLAGETAVKVSFSVPYRCEYGQNLSLVGSVSTLGGWNLQGCTDMSWNDGDIWRADLDFPARYVTGDTQLSLQLSCLMEKT